MRILTSTNFARARKFILTEGRNLESAFFRYQFENGPKEDVLAALRAYQNADGGFGRALEPDIRTQASSAIATQHALETLRALLPVQDEMISRVVEYLVRTFDDNRAVWPIVPPQVEDAPHAPWWTYETAEEGFGGYRANPTAAIAGLLQDHRSLFPDDILQQSIAQALDYLSSLPAEGVPIHDFLCFITLAESLEDVRKQIVLDKLARAIPHTIAFDMADWESYGLRPIAAAPRPDSILHPFIDSSALESNLDFEIQEQLPDGSWPITWSWAFIDAAEWSKAEKEWKSFHTLNKLILFKAYGRLEVS